MENLKKKSLSLMPNYRFNYSNRLDIRGIGHYKQFVLSDPILNGNLWKAFNNRDENMEQKRQRFVKLLSDLPQDRDNSVDLVLSLMYVRTNERDDDIRELIKGLFIEFMIGDERTPLTYVYELQMTTNNGEPKDIMFYDFNLIRILSWISYTSSHHKETIKEWISFLKNFEGIDYMERDYDRIETEIRTAIVAMERPQYVAINQRIEVMGNRVKIEIKCSLGAKTFLEKEFAVLDLKTRLLTDNSWTSLLEMQALAQTDVMDADLMIYGELFSIEATKALVRADNNSFAAKFGYKVLEIIRHLNLDIQLIDIRLEQIPENGWETVFFQYMWNEAKRDDEITTAPIIWPFIQMKSQRLNRREKFLLLAIAANLWIRFEMMVRLTQSREYSYGFHTSSKNLIDLMRDAANDANEDFGTKEERFKNEMKDLMDRYLGHCFEIQEAMRVVAQRSDSVSNIEVITSFEGYTFFSTELKFRYIQREPPINRFNTMNAIRKGLYFTKIADNNYRYINGETNSIVRPENMKSNEAINLWIESNQSDYQRCDYRSDSSDSEDIESVLEEQMVRIERFKDLSQSDKQNERTERTRSAPTRDHNTNIGLKGEEEPIAGTSGMGRQNGFETKRVTQIPVICISDGEEGTDTEVTMAEEAVTEKVIPQPDWDEWLELYGKESYADLWVQMQREKERQNERRDPVADAEVTMAEMDASTSRGVPETAWKLVTKSYGHEKFDRTRELIGTAIRPGLPQSGWDLMNRDHGIESLAIVKRQIAINNEEVIKETKAENEVLAETDALIQYTFPEVDWKAVYKSYSGEGFVEVWNELQTEMELQKDVKEPEGDEKEDASEDREVSAVEPMKMETEVTEEEEKVE